MFVGLLHLVLLLQQFITLQILCFCIYIFDSCHVVFSIWFFLRFFSICFLFSFRLQFSWIFLFSFSTVIIELSFFLRVFNCFFFFFGFRILLSNCFWKNVACYNIFLSCSSMFNQVLTRFLFRFFFCRYTFLYRSFPLA